MQHCYRPQRSCGKIMFLYLSVILFTMGVSGRPPRQVLSWADTPRADSPRADSPRAHTSWAERDSHCSRWYVSYWNAFLLPPANKACEGYIFTGVCLSTGGCLPHTCPLPLPLVQTPHPGQTPLWTDTPSWADPPPGQTPLLGRPHPGQTPPGTHPPGQTLPWVDTPSPTQCMLGCGQQVDGMHPTGMHLLYHVTKTHRML